MKIVRFITQFALIVTTLVAGDGKKRKQKHRGKTHKPSPSPPSPPSPREDLNLCSLADPQKIQIGALGEDYPYHLGFPKDTTALWHSASVFTIFVGSVKDYVESREMTGSSGIDDATLRISTAAESVGLAHKSLNLSEDDMCTMAIALFWPMIHTCNFSTWPFTDETYMKVVTILMTSFAIGSGFDGFDLHSYCSDNELGGGEKDDTDDFHPDDDL